jgi:hypothetical protein
MVSVVFEVVPVEQGDPPGQAIVNVYVTTCPLVGSPARLSVTVTVAVLVLMSAFASLDESRAAPATATAAANIASTSTSLPWRDLGAASVISASL